MARAKDAGPRHRNDDALTRLIWWLNWAYARLWHRVRARGHERIPRHGPLILAANHTAGVDPCLMQAVYPRVIRWLMLTSYRFTLLAPLWRVIRPITLDRRSSDLVKLREVLRVLGEGEALGLFPEGGLQHDRRDLSPFQPGIGMIARRSRAAIVPVWITGTPRRKNMLWQFLQPSRSEVTFGEAYTPDPAQSNEQIVADLRRRMLALAKHDQRDDQ